MKECQKRKGVRWGSSIGGNEIQKRREAKARREKRNMLNETRMRKQRENKQGQLPNPFRDVGKGQGKKAGRLNANLCHINSILWV